jgi:syndecan 1
VQRLPVATAPPTAVPLSPDTTAPNAPGGPDAPLKAAARTTPAAGAAIQRVPEDTEPTDVSPPPEARSRIPVPVKKTLSSAEKSPTPPQRGDGIDVEDLARRLIDPVARLLRADVRRGRERAGRLYDGRR